MRSAGSERIFFEPCVELHQIDHQPISHGACIGGIALHPEQHCSDEWGNLVERAN